MNLMKRIDCVYSRNKLDFKKYSRNASYQEVISYFDIISKLIKNDVDGLKPSEFVVNSYIRKKFLKAVTDSDDILYALKNLDAETVNSIRSLASEAYEGEITFNLIVIDSKKYKIDICDDINNMFNEIVFIEND
jgi:hypothetical protein